MFFVTLYEVTWLLLLGCRTPVHCPECHVEESTRSGPSPCCSNKFAAWSYRRGHPILLEASAEGSCQQKAIQGISKCPTALMILSLIMTLKHTARSMRACVAEKGLPSNAVAKSCWWKRPPSTLQSLAFFSTVHSIGCSNIRLFQGSMALW